MSVVVFVFRGIWFTANLLSLGSDIFILSVRGFSSKSMQLENLPNNSRLSFQQNLTTLCYF